MHCPHRTGLHVWLIVLTIAIVISDRKLHADDERDPRFVDALDPTTATLAHVSEPWTIWTTRELVEATRMHRVRSFTVRYYLQAIGGEHALLVHQTEGTSWPEPYTVREGGTVLLARNWNVVWAAPEQASRQERAEIDGQAANLLSAWPDGAVLQPARFGVKVDRFAPLYWVPIRDGQFNFAEKVQLSDERGIDASPRPTLMREGSQIAWMDATHLGRELPEDLQRPPRLFVYDLEEQQRMQFEVSVGRSTRLSSFDGRWAYTGTTLIDTRSGKVENVPHRPWKINRNRIGYRLIFEEGQYRLVAADVARPDEEIVLEAFNAFDVPGIDIERFSIQPHQRQQGMLRSLSNQILFATQDGIWLWDGAHWIWVPWLEDGRLTKRG